MCTLVRSIVEADFWDRAFGGKDLLRLCIGATDFRIRRNVYSTCATFKFGDGSRVRIVYKYVSMYDDKKSYWVTVYKGEDSAPHDRWAPEIYMIRNTVQQLTGYVLDCFQS